MGLLLVFQYLHGTDFIPLAAGGGPARQLLPANLMMQAQFTGFPASLWRVLAIDTAAASTVATCIILCILLPPRL